MRNPKPTKRENSCVWGLNFNPLNPNILYYLLNTPRERHRLNRDKHEEQERDKVQLSAYAILLFGYFVFWASIVANFWIIRFMLEN